MFIDLTGAARSARRGPRLLLRHLSIPATKKPCSSSATARRCQGRQADGLRTAGSRRRLTDAVRQQGFGDIRQRIFTNGPSAPTSRCRRSRCRPVGPTLQVHGNDEQRSQVPRPRSWPATSHFAIGYTEADAGTDLASSRRDGGARRRPLRRQRAEDLHHRRPRRRLLHLARGAH